MTTAEPMVAVPVDLSQGRDTDFCCRVEEVASQSPRSLSLDCSALDLVHSSHIGLLWQAREICRQRSTGISLENTSNSLIRALQALDLTDIFGVNVPGYQRSTMSSPGRFLNLQGGPHAGSFGADVAGVDHGLCEFLELLERWQLTEEMKFDMRTLFYETATNIRCHSGLPADCRIQYRATLTNGELQLVFEDNGKPFNPMSHPDTYNPETAAHSHQTRGFGLSLIRRLADDIEYTYRDDSTNVLSITKRYGE